MFDVPAEAVDVVATALVLVVVVVVVVVVPTVAVVDVVAGVVMDGTVVVAGVVLSGVVLVSDLRRRFPGSGSVGSGVGMLTVETQSVSPNPLLKSRVADILAAAPRCISI